MVRPLGVAMMREVFRNRREAGRLLAAELVPYAHRPDLVVLGLPRGGVPVAFEVAKALHAPLDVFVVRKLGTPSQPELAMGAIASGGVHVLNADVIRELGISIEAVHETVAAEELELKRRELAYRGQVSLPAVQGKTVILIDDGVATGCTMRAAIRALNAQHPRRIVAATPTASRAAGLELQSQVDEWIALMRPEPFYGVGQWYEDFCQTSDQEVRDLLLERRQSL
jgi:putative phosphoribosyl transferase